MKKENYILFLKDRIKAQLFLKKHFVIEENNRILFY